MTMKTSCKFLLQEVEEMTPRSVKYLLRKMGLDRVRSLFVDKYDVELAFQRKWAKEFELNKGKVCEYWKKYRYLDTIKRICQIDQNKTILDVGCGISTVLHYIDGKRHGIDPLADEYRKLYHYPDDITISQGRGEDLPFKEQCFDIAFCSNVLDHTENPRKTIAEIFRALKASGSFVLTVEVFAADRKRDLAHPHTFTKESVHTLIRKKFFTVFEDTSPWIGARQYVQGGRKSATEELVVILQKHRFRRPEFG